MIKKILSITTLTFIIFAGASYLITTSAFASNRHVIYKKYTNTTHYSYKPQLQINCTILQGKANSRQLNTGTLQVQEQICNVFGADGDKALKIAQLESGFNCSAVHVNSDRHKTRDLGLFQINAYYNSNKFRGRNPMNCTDSINIAKEIYIGWDHSFRAWSTSRYL